VLQFHYHRAVAPMLWVLMGLSGLELLVMHFLLALWNGWVALAVSLLTLAGMVWLGRLLLSMKRLPVLLDEARLVMRVGTLRRFDIGRANIAGLRESWESGAERAGGVANLALLAYPNIMVDLAEPLPRKRLFRTSMVATVAHRLDDLPAFLAAMKETTNR